MRSRANLLDGPSPPPKNIEPLTGKREILNEKTGRTVPAAPRILATGDSLLLLISGALQFLLAS